MSVKNLNPKRGQFKQGFYTQLNNKYVGPTPIIYRSSWEYKFMVYCDKNESILKWSSECMRIKYYNPIDKKFHHYYPDFYIEVLKDGAIMKYIVEIKPSSLLKKPVQPKRLTEQTYNNYRYAAKEFTKNLYKSEAAKKVAAEMGMEYIILTEKSLK
jgi:hypothetical protein